MDGASGLQAGKGSGQGLDLLNEADSLSRDRVEDRVKITGTETIFRLETATACGGGSVEGREVGLAIAMSGSGAVRPLFTTGSLAATGVIGCTFVAEPLRVSSPSCVRVSMQRRSGSSRFRDSVGIEGGGRRGCRFELSTVVREACRRGAFAIA